MLIALLALVGALVFLSLPAAAETASISPPQHDGYYYTPDETVTVTVGGLLSQVAYDVEVQLPNGTIVLANRNFTGDNNGEAMWTFDIPAEWEGTYYVRLYQNLTHSYEAQRSFIVRMFWLNTELDHVVYLPGDTVSVFYYTQRLDDQKPLSNGVGRWRATIMRDNGTGPVIYEDIGNSFSATSGKFSFNLPTGSLSQAFTLTVTFNDTTDKHSVSTTEVVRVGSLDLSVSLNRGTYEPGDSVVATVSARAGQSFYTEPLEGVVIKTTIYRYDAGNGTWGEDMTYNVADQTTQFDGSAAFVVVIHTDAKDGELYRVTVSATSGGTSHEASNQFTVYESATLLINLEIQETSYRPGQTLQATVTLTTSNATLKSGAMYEWTVSSTSTSRVLLFEYKTQGSVSFPIPADYSGNLRVTVRIFTPDDQVYTRTDTVSVFSRALLINPATTYFQPGDTVGVDVEVVSDQITDTIFVWSVVPSSGGDPIANGRVTSGDKTGHFEFMVPDPSDTGYTVSVSASGNGIVVSDSTSISRGKYVALEVKVPQRSFKPGETVDIEWTLHSVGGATIPPTTTLSVYLTGGWGTIGAGSRSFDVAGSSGTIHFKIPDSAPESADLQLTVTGSGVSSAGSSLYMRPGGGANPINAASDGALFAMLIAVLGVALGIFALMKMSKGPGAAAASSSSSAAVRESPRSYGDLKSETRASSDSKPIVGGGSDEMKESEGDKPKE